MAYIMPFMLAMVVTIAWVPVLGRVARRWLIVDMPAERKVHRVPIPRVGGVAIALGVGVAALLAVPLQPTDRYFLGAAAVLAFFGALDDRFDLDYRLKLAGQLIAVAIVVFGGDLRIQALTLDDHVMLSAWIGIPLTIVFLVGITNAINLADGLDGLAGGTTFLCLCALAMLAYSGGEFACAAMALAFAGAVLGFLRFNTFPATVFMGDAGSQLLGFAVGALSLRATQSGSSAVSAATPVLLMALPILDTLSVMVQRISEGRSPFSADKNHLHHKLLALGFDHHEAVMVIYAVQADLFLLAYWMRYESDVVILATMSAFCAAAILLLQMALRRGWRFRATRQQRQASPLSRLLTRLRRPENLPRWTYLTVAGALGAYALIILSETASVSNDVRLLLLALFMVMLAWLAVLRVKPLNLMERGVLYVTAAVLVYLDSVVLPGERLTAAWSWIALLIGALATVLRLQTSRDRRFELTPLDLIILFVALVLPSLSGSLGLPDAGAAGIAKLVILFYGLEVLLSREEIRVVWLRVGIVALLLGLVLRPMLNG